MNFLQKSKRAVKQHYSMKIPLATVLCILFGLLSQAHASETAEDFDGRTYILVPQAKNWQMAKRDAEARGGHLVAISSAAEQRFIEQLIDKAMGREVLPVWIGLTDEEGEGIWKWVNGETLSYTNWQRHQPSNSNNITPEHYCVIWHSNAQSPLPNGYRGAKKGEWNDVAGDNNLPYIIEFDSIRER
jgi:hypothetical protein